MSIRFAGSRFVDERRRRRLAQEADAATGESTDESTTSRTAEDGVESVDEAAALESQSRADSLITPKLWKHVLLGLSVVTAWVGMLIIGDRSDAGQLPMAGILGLQQGKLATFFSTVMLLAAGQFSLINLWYRSRSRKDFSGSYKLWFYVAICWLTFCAATATGVHVTMADSILRAYPIAVWNIQSLMWLVPAAIMLLPLSKLLLREMRDCRGSSRLLQGVLFVAALAMSTHLFGELFLTVREQALWSTALATGWQMLLAMSMLTHARHVIHVSNEAPKSPISSGSGLFTRALQWLFSPSARKNRQETTSDSSTMESDESAAGKCQTSSRKKRATASSSKRKTTSKRSTPTSKSKNSNQQPSDVNVASDAEEDAEPVEESAFSHSQQVESSSSGFENSDSELDDVDSQYDTDDVADEKVSSSDRSPSASSESKGGNEARVQRFDAPQAVRGPKSNRRSAPVDEEEEADGAYGEDDGADESNSSGTSAKRVDPADLKGLSKRERRELQRKHKQMQRQSGR